MEAAVHADVNLLKQAALMDPLTGADYGGTYPMDKLVTFKFKNEIVIDPWGVGEDEPFIKEAYYGHGDITKGFDPFKKYGNKKLGKFVEEIVTFCDESEIAAEEYRQELMIKAEEYIEITRRLGINSNYPDNYPYSDIDEIKDFIACWSEFKG